MTLSVKPCHLHTSSETMECLSLGWVTNTPKEIRFNLKKNNFIKGPVFKQCLRFKVTSHLLLQLIFTRRSPFNGVSLAILKQ